MTQRKRKQEIVAAQRAWSAAASKPNFVPANWYRPRNPRCKHVVFTNDLGQYQGFSMSAGGSYIAVLHADERAAMLEELGRLVALEPGAALVRGELGTIDGEIRFVAG